MSNTQGFNMAGDRRRKLPLLNTVLQPDTNCQLCPIVTVMDARLVYCCFSDIGVEFCSLFLQ